MLVSISSGRQIDYINGGADIAAGDAVPLGDSVGVAITDIPSGKAGALALAGVWRVAKNAGEVVTAGDKLTLRGGFELSEVGDYGGVAVSDAGADDEFVSVKLIPGRYIEAGLFMLEGGGNLLLEEGGTMVLEA